ncbi:hypothetical protein [Chryseobacterium culicis]|uniref:Lipoprotein n=1 Tax=Chryseobacterium culicis TaxID=680127 RepID=A0A1H6H7B0_CHRCI|nr:hypothetical protein [Chryseobacterium culicis]SEH29883.1 hypothetical protein SAMN05421593_1208 [Chryseobacterium culicis]
MKKIFLLSIIFLFAVVISCSKRIPSEKGGIDIISNVYFNASRGLDNMRSFHVSKLNYKHDSIIEMVPELEFPEMTKVTYFIKDSVFYVLENDHAAALLAEVQKKQKPILVYRKNAGAIFTKDQILNYRNRRNLSDTILFKKHYKRFEINSPWNYTRYYIYPTDTILPYSFYKEVDNDYHGRIERIDSYDKQKDIFVSMQLIPRKNWDLEAEEIFKFNRYIESRKKK